MEGGEPGGGVVAVLGADAVEQVDGLGAPGEDRQFILKAVQPQFGDDGVQPLLDEELPRYAEALRRLGE